MDNLADHRSVVAIFGITAGIVASNWTCYIGVTNLMSALGCRIAERLLWDYITALGDSDNAHKAYVDAIRTGPSSAIPAMSRRLDAAVAAVEEARRAFQEHSREHGCCPEKPIEPLPSPQSSALGPKRRTRRRQ
jgi:hypothetical protein